jgi:hypothetical protein
MVHYYTIGSECALQAFDSVVCLTPPNRDFKPASWRMSKLGPNVLAIRASHRDVEQCCPAMMHLGLVSSRQHFPRLTRPSVIPSVMRKIKMQLLPWMKHRNGGLLHRYHQASHKTEKGV